MDKSLETIIKSVPNIGETEYLEKLSPEEQKKLSELIHKVVEEEGSTLFSTLAFVSKVIPNFLKAKIAQDIMGPKMTAKMTAYLPASQAIAVAKILKTEFLADVALYLQPDKVAEIVEGSPDNLLINVTKNLLGKGNYDILAGFSDHLSPAKLKILAEKINDSFGIVQIANDMVNKERMIDTAITFSDNYLLDLMKAISHFHYYELAAMVGQELSIDRQVNLLQHLEEAEAAKLAAHYDPGIIAKIMDRIKTETAVNIALQMEGKVLGACFNYLEPEQINKILPYLSVEKVLESVPHINFKKLETEWEQIGPEAEKVLRKLTGDSADLSNFFESLGGK